MKLIFRPRKVTEVARVQAKKKFFKSSAIFELQQRNTLLKKLRIILIQIWNKIRGFYYEKVEKKIYFVIFDPKNHNLGSVLAEFLENLPR